MTKIKFKTWKELRATCVTRFSEVLDEEYTLSVDGSAYFEESDVFYTRDEISKIKNTGDEAIRLIHEVKAVFDGAIVDREY